MIKDIIIPGAIGSYYVLPERVIGFDINKTDIYATVLLLRGREVIIEKFLQEHLSTDVTTPYAEQVRIAIKKIMTNAGRINTIATALPSAQVVFKELQIPFTDAQKISLVVRYEAEPFLPFPAQEAVIDFTITNVQPHSCSIIAVAAQRSTVSECVQLFADVSIKPSIITVDALALYELFLRIPTYATTLGPVVLIDCGMHTTRLLYIIDRQLKVVRTLSKGLGAAAKTFGTAQGLQPREALEQMVRFGVNNEQDALQQAFTPLISEIKFTTQATSSMLNVQEPTTLLIAGTLGSIPYIATLLNKQMNVPCTLFSAQQLLEDKHVSVAQGQTIPVTHTLSLSYALPAATTHECNLYQEQEAQSDSLILKQIGVGLLLMLAIIGTLIGNTFYQSRSLSSTIRNAEQEAVVALRDRVGVSERTLTRALDEAQKKVEQEEEILGAFSGKTRASFLQYLQKLSSAIDRSGLGLELKRLEISLIGQPRIMLEGSVKDFPELQMFQENLYQTGLFKSVPPLQEKTFNITLLLASAEGVS